MAVHLEEGCSEEIFSSNLKSFKKDFENRIKLILPMLKSKWKHMLSFFVKGEKQKMWLIWNLKQFEFKQCINVFILKICNIWLWKFLCNIGLGFSFFFSDHLQNVSILKNNLSLVRYIKNRFNGERFGVKQNLWIELEIFPWMFKNPMKIGRKVVGSNFETICIYGPVWFNIKQTLKLLLFSSNQFFK